MPKRKRLLIVGGTTLGTFAVYLCLRRWMDLRSGSLFAQAGITASGANPSLWDLIPDSIYFLTWTFASMALILAGRRRIFWLPLVLSSTTGTFLLDLLFALARRNWESIRGAPWLYNGVMLIATWLPLVPAVALLRTTGPGPQRLKPDRTSWTCASGLAALILIALLLPHLDVFHIGLSTYDLVFWSLYKFSYYLLSALTYFIFGAGLGTRRPLWPWAHIVPGLLAFVWLVIDRWRDFADIVAATGLRGLITHSYFLSPFAGMILWTIAIPYLAATWEPFQRYRQWRRWRREPGDSVVLRERWQEGIWAARAATVVMDTAAEKRFYVPVGAPEWYPADDEDNEMRLPLEDWRLEERTTRTRHLLSFAWRNKPYAIFVAWDPDWKFTGYYVNLQSPLERKRNGFDYVEHVLDIEMSPDKQTWSWKDDEELKRTVEEGLFSKGEAADFHEWGEAAVEHILYETPFDEDCSTWRPDPDWPLPELPEDWDELD